MTCNQQPTLYLVEGDRSPPLYVRFTDLNLSNYSEVWARIEFENGTRLSREMTPDGEDVELALLAWEAGDLVRGRHSISFEFLGADNFRMTLPRKWPVILSVRRDLG